MKISATLIALNEEKNLERAIASVRNFADEVVVVVDMRSSDNTLAVAKRLGAKSFVREFDNFSNQKNFAVEKAAGEWIFSLDADEEVSPELASEIKSKIQNPKSQFSSYSMPRKNVIFGKFIKYTRWQPELDRHIWLWQKSKGQWIGDVHEEVKVDGPVGKLKNAKIHYQYETVEEFMDMMNGYSELNATQRVKNGVKFSWFKLFFDPAYNFLVRYFYRLGFLDGWRGFALSYLMAIYHLEVWIKVWERMKVKEVSARGG